uniref:Uncharacterized protein n=1 Tax=Populus alba TaxID=43335 RepID=A0A4V6A9D4_POPAL|nr:hypothetical protein D5086_0000121290 [Populus alba]
MARREENYGPFGGNHLRDGYQGMQAVWDQLDCHSVGIVGIATLKGRMQTEFGDINARFDDLTTMLEELGLCANMNRGRREPCAVDEARNQPVLELIRANPLGQYD